MTRTESSQSKSSAAGQQHRYETVSLDTLRPNPRNARKHPKSQIREIERSYQEYGVINPIIVAPDMTILAGHGRYQAAKAMGLQEIPVLIVDGLSAAQLKAYSLADNKIGDLSSFDMKLVLEEIQAISVEDASFDITRTGFVTAEIDMVLGATRTAELNDLDDDLPPELPARAISREGDLWLLGPHRLICGDSTSAATIDLLLDGRKAGLLLSDVPYNVKIAGNVSGLGKKVHEEFAMASGEMTPEEFFAFLRSSAKVTKPHLINGAMVLWFIDWRHVSEMIEAGRASGLELKNLLTWVKSNPAMGSLWRSQHELVCAFKYGDAQHVNNVQLGAHGRNRSNVLFYPGMNAPGAGRGQALDMHATVKPVALIADLMLDVSRSGDIVLDPFGGSGTAIVAAEKVGRVAFLAEISPKFVDVAIARWEKLTGGSARLADGRTFATVSASRDAEAEVEAA